MDIKDRRSESLASTINAIDIKISNPCRKSLLWDGLKDHVLKDDIWNLWKAVELGAYNMGVENDRFTKF